MLSKRYESTEVNRRTNKSKRKQQQQQRYMYICMEKNQ